MTRERVLLKRGLASRDGNVAIIFALSMIPMIGCVGLGVDYGIALTNKSRLDGAADAAALAAVVTAKAYVADNAGQANLDANATAAGLDRAKRAFATNIGTLLYASVPDPTITLVRTKQTFTSVVSYRASNQSQFGKLFNTTTFNLAGSASASADVASYLDFYLLVDVSGSMGLPSTATGQTALAAINKDDYSAWKQGCQFACHFPNYTGFTLAQKNNIQLRSGAVNTAVCDLLKRAAAPLVPNQYRVGIYPFITRMDTLVGLTSDYATLASLTTCDQPTPTKFTDLLDTGSTQLNAANDPTDGIGSGGTHFETALPQMKDTIATFGDGSSAKNPRPFVFLITDGMQNPQYYSSTKNGKIVYAGNPSKYSGYSASGFNGGSSPQAVNSTLCTALKTAGATISVLYIPYTPISYINDPYGEAAMSNKAIPSLPTALKNCATPGFFYTANTPDDITAALAAMFNQAIQVAHLNK